MGVINIPKLLELYKELYSNYRNEHEILIVREGMSKEEIQNTIDKANYIRFIIRKIEEDYMAKDKRTVTAKELDDFLTIFKTDVGNISVTATIYTLYLIAIQLMEKK